jgi:hypothetical protein
LPVALPRSGSFSASTATVAQDCPSSDFARALQQIATRVLGCYMGGRRTGWGFVGQTTAGCIHMELKL